MAQLIRCSSCQKSVQLPDEFIGKYVECPMCGNRFLAQGEAPPFAVAAQPPPVLGAPPPGQPLSRDWDAPYDRDWDDLRRDRYYERDYRRLAPNHGQTVLTLGILSFVVCPLVLSLIAIILGSSDLREIRAGRMDPSGEGSARAGMICGIVSLSLFGLLILFYIVVLSATVSRF